PRSTISSWTPATIVHPLTANSPAREPASWWNDGPKSTPSSVASQKNDRRRAGPSHRSNHHEPRRQRQRRHQMDGPRHPDDISDRAGEQGADRVSEIAPESIDSEARRAP